MSTTAMLVVVVMIAAGLVGAVPSSPDQTNHRSPRASANQANVILDKITAKAVETMTAIGWDTVKRVKQSTIELLLIANRNTSIEANTSETFSIKNVAITGLTNLTRSQSATFNSNNTILTGKVKLLDLTITADYTIDFDGYDMAPPDSSSGTITESISSVFADIEVTVDGNDPQKLKSFEIYRVGLVDITSVAGMTGGNMGQMHMVGIKQALQEVVIHTINTNVKAHVRGGILNIKAADFAK